jgi:hypothetical protein
MTGEPLVNQIGAVSSPVRAMAHGCASYETPDNLVYTPKPHIFLGFALVQTMCVERSRKQPHARDDTFYGSFVAVMMSMDGFTGGRNGWLVCGSSRDFSA